MLMLGITILNWIVFFLAVTLNDAVAGAISLFFLVSAIVLTVDSIYRVVIYIHKLIEEAKSNDDKN